MVIMHRNPLIQTIQDYEDFILPKFPEDSHEPSCLGRFRQFIAEEPQCFDTQNPRGHITGSALIVNRDFSRVVLTLHRKLGIWVQLGGHADGDALIERVALREAQEESGLTRLSHFPLEGRVLPFDWDIHEIPASAKIPAHWHYDVRYLIMAEDHELTISEESQDLRWIALDEVREYTREPSMLRQFSKLRYISQ